MSSLLLNCRPVFKKCYIFSRVIQKRVFTKPFFFECQCWRSCNNAASTSTGERLNLISQDKPSVAEQNGREKIQLTKSLNYTDSATQSSDLENENLRDSESDETLKMKRIDPARFIKTNFGIDSNLAEKTFEPSARMSNIDNLKFVLSRYQRVSLAALKRCIEELEQNGISNEEELENAGLILSSTGATLEDLMPARRIELTDRVWNVVKQSDMPININIINILLGVYNENQLRFEAFEMLSMLKELDIEPDLHTYALLIFSYCEYGEMEPVSELLDRVHANGFTLNHPIFHLLILGHFKSDNTEAAFEILDLMREVRIVPYFDTYGLMLRLFAEKGDKDGMEWVMKEMKSNGMPLKSFLLFQCVEKLVTNSHEDLIPEVMTRIEEDPKKYYKDAIVLVKRLITLGYEKAAYEIYLDFFKEEINKAEEIDKLTLKGRFILNTLAINSSYEAIKPIVCDMEDKGEKRAISEMTRLVMKAERSELGVQMLELMKERGHTIRGHMFFPVFTQFKKLENSEGLLNVFRVYHTIVTPSLQTNFSSILYQYLLPLYHNLGVNYEEYLSILQNDGYDKETIDFAYFCYLVMNKSFEEALQFGTNKEMKIFHPVLNELKFHPKFLSEWKTVFQILKVCSEKSDNKETELPGDILVKILSKTKDDSHLEIVQYFMSLDLKIKGRHIHYLKYCGAPVPLLKELVQKNCYNKVAFTPLSWVSGDIKSEKEKKRDFEEIDPKTLFVKNIPYTITEDDLMKIFPGSIEIRMPRSREFDTSRGMAYLTFKESSGVKAALATKQGLVINGRALKLDNCTAFIDRESSGKPSQQSRSSSRKRWNTE